MKTIKCIICPTQFIQSSLSEQKCVRCRNALNDIYSSYNIHITFSIFTQTQLQTEYECGNNIWIHTTESEVVEIHPLTKLITQTDINSDGVVHKECLYLNIYNPSPKSDKDCDTKFIKKVLNGVVKRLNSIDLTNDI